MKTFFIVLIVVVILLIGMAVISVGQAMYVPREGDILKDRNGKFYKVLGANTEPNTVIGIEIDPETEEVKFNVPKQILMLTDMTIVKLNEVSPFGNLF